MSQSYSRRDWLTLRTDRTGAGESSVAIDLGAHTLKLGYANATAPYCTPNCAVRCRATRAVHWAAEADACNAPPGERWLDSPNHLVYNTIAMGFIILDFFSKKTKNELITIILIDSFELLLLKVVRFHLPF